MNRFAAKHVPRYGIRDEQQDEYDWEITEWRPHDVSKSQWDHRSCRSLSPWLVTFMSSLADHGLDENDSVLSIRWSFSVRPATPNDLVCWWQSLAGYSQSRFVEWGIGQAKLWNNSYSYKRCDTKWIANGLCSQISRLFIFPLCNCACSTLFFRQWTNE